MFKAHAPLIKQEQILTDEVDVQWALDLLKPDPNYKPTIMQTYTAEGLCVGSGLAFACLKNYINNRPSFSGIQSHGIYMIAGYFIAQVLNKYIDKHKAERDTRLRNYLMLHPELFRASKRAKYGDLFEPWHPVR